MGVRALKYPNTTPEVGRSDFALVRSGHMKIIGACLVVLPEELTLIDLGRSSVMVKVGHRSWKVECHNKLPVIMHIRTVMKSG